MIIKIKIYPKSNEQKVIKVSDSGYKVYVKSEADKNKANVELCKLLQRYFKRQVRIKSGLTSRNKIIEVLK